jgi:hypothetical protein
MNDVATRTAGTAVANPNTNYFQSYGDQVSQRSIVGSLLKFSKGDFLAGENEEEVEEGTRFVANMDELMVGWIRWWDAKPSDQIMGRVSDGYQPPKRNELGDDDKSRWELDDKNEPKDPWQFSNYLILKAEEGDELFTFTTSSRGGLNAIGELCKAYGKAMRQRPDEYPIIALGVGSYQHSNKAYGRIKFPIFDIVGWAGKADFAQALAAETGGEAGEESEAAAPAAAAGKKAAASRKPAAAEQTRF